MSGISRRLFVLFLSLLLIGSAAADPVASYRSVQESLLAAAYTVQPFDAVLSGAVAAVVPSYSFKNTYYIFVRVDEGDVAMWSTEDDNFFVTMLTSEADPFPFEVGENITVEGRISPVYSSPVCPYITPEKINGSADY